MNPLDTSDEEKRMIRELQRAVDTTTSESELKRLKGEYSDYNHPYPSYFLAAAFERVGNKDESLKLYVDALAQHTKLPNDYWNNQHSNTIGSAISNIISSYDISQLDEDVKIYLNILGYAYLSRCIELLSGIEGARVYESLFNRGKVIGRNKDVVTDITQRYLGYGVLPQVMAFSDFYLAHLDYLRDGRRQQAKTALENANHLRDWLDDIDVSGTPASEYADGELAEIGLKRNRKMFDNIKQDLLDNSYFIESDQIKKEIISSVRQK